MQTHRNDIYSTQYLYHSCAVDVSFELIYNFNHGKPKATAMNSKRSVVPDSEIGARKPTNTLNYTETLQRDIYIVYENIYKL